MLALDVSLRVHAHLVATAEVNLVHWLLDLALEGLLEKADLVVLVHGIAGDVVLVQ